MNKTSNWDLAYNYGMSALSNLGGTLGAFGSAKSNKANADIARLNKQRMERNYNAAIGEMEINKALNLASNRMDYILSGFKVGSGGSTDLVQKLTEKTYNKDIEMLRLNKRTEQSIYDRQIRSFEDAAKAEEQEGIFGGIMTAVDIAATIAMII